MSISHVHHLGLEGSGASWNLHIMAFNPIYGAHHD